MIRRVLVGMLVTVMCSSCILVPFIDSFHNLGFTKADRERLFEERIKDYKLAMMDGKASRLAAFMKEEGQDEFRRELRGDLKSRKIVDATIDYVKFDEEAEVADAEILVKYYRVPNYVVREELEGQKWTFSVENGWRLSSRQLIDEQVG